MPALIAFATERNLSLSSDLRFCEMEFLVKVVSSHFRTSLGTASDWTSLRSPPSSSSETRLVRWLLRLGALGMRVSAWSAGSGLEVARPQWPVWAAQFWT